MPAPRRRGPIETWKDLGAIVLFAIATVFAIVAVIFVIRSDRRKPVHAAQSVRPIALTQPERLGRDLFAQHCAVCHTLAAAGASGTVGPNLDQVKPSAPVTLATIAQAPVGMPSSLVTGAEARAVAQFVAAVTAR